MTTATAVKISIRNYGEYSSTNYGAHALEVDLGPITLYFSYSTVVAFITGKTGRVIRQNDWSTTTGKHLNWIDPDHSKRLPSAEFEAKLRAALKHYRIEV